MVGYGSDDKRWRAALERISRRLEGSYVTAVAARRIRDGRVIERSRCPALISYLAKALSLINSCATAYQSNRLGRSTVVTQARRIESWIYVTSVVRIREVTVAIAATNGYSQKN